MFDELDQGVLEDNICPVKCDLLWSVFGEVYRDYLQGICLGNFHFRFCQLSKTFKTGKSSKAVFQHVFFSTFSSSLTMLGHVGGKVN